MLDVQRSGTVGEESDLSGGNFGHEKLGPTIERMKAGPQREGFFIVRTIPAHGGMGEWGEWLRIRRDP
jgi:hypothetical protein